MSSEPRSGTNKQSSRIPASIARASPPSFGIPFPIAIRHSVSRATPGPQAHQDAANPAVVAISKTGSTALTPVVPSRSNMDMYIYWDLTTWNRLISRSKPTLREVFGLLGIAIPANYINTKGVVTFDDPILTALNMEICSITANIQKDDRIPEMAANRESLKEEKEALMAKHGMLVWGRDKGRILVFEDPQDKAEIILHLHQWIFLKAFNSWRNAVEATRRKKKGAALIAAGTKRPAQVSSPHKAKKTKSQVFYSPSAGDIQTLPAALSKEPRDPFTDESDNERLFELAGHLVKYLHSKPDTVTHKDFLTLLEDHWMEYAPHYENVFGSLYAVATHVLTSWIAERRNLIAFEDSIPKKMKLEDRFLAANDIRIKRVKWNHLSVQHHSEMMSSTDILCHTFATITDSTGNGTLAMFRDGLQKLHGALEHVEGGNVVIELH